MVDTLTQLSWIQMFLMHVYVQQKLFFFFVALFFFFFRNHQTKRITICVGVLRESSPNSPANN